MGRVRRNHFSLKGVDGLIADVSKHQGDIDWGQLSGSLDFAIVKASGKVKDPFFEQNASGCKRYKVPMHVYHYLYCRTIAKAKAEAKLFSDSVGNYEPLFWVLDCEKGSGIAAKKARAIVDAFEAELRRLRGNDIRVAVYIAHELYKPWALDYSRFEYVWIPRYGKNDGTIAGSIKPDHPCHMWQYTSRGRLPGINGDVDLNVLVGDKPMEFFTGKTSTTEKADGGETTMAKLVSISTFIKELEAALNRKDGYIMGARGQNPRTGYLDLSKTDVKSSWKENGYYFTQYSGSQRTQALRWRKSCTRVWDCNGMAEGIYEIHTGVNIDSKARYNYANWCSVKGSGIIPANRRVPGAAVFWSNNGASSIHHVAYLWKPVKEGHPEGDWYIIEARGVMYGVVSGKLLSRKPNFWGYMDKYFDYSDSVKIEDVVEVVDTRTLGSRVLKNGSEGNDVKEMQTGLIRLGYDLGHWGADGDFGDCTELAVKKFQKDHGITDSGKFDAATLKAYEAALVALDSPVENPRIVKIVGGQCYVRTAPDKETGKVLGVAKEGTEHQFGGNIAENGWLLIAFKNTNGWVSDKYGKLVS